SSSAVKEEVTPMMHKMNSVHAKEKVRQYSDEYLLFGFIPATHDERLPFCLLCHQCLTNESMKRGRLENHLKAKHSIHVNSKLEYFKSLKEKFEKRSTINSLFSARSASKDRGLEASYEISLLIAKCCKNHTIGENLIKPAMSTFLKVVLEKDDQDLKSMPLSNNTVSSRIDEMSCDVEVQLVEKLKYTNFSIQLDESTVRDSEALLMAYVRYVDNGEFIEDMLFCEALETTTIAIDKYKKLKTYLDDKQIPMENIISFDGKALVSYLADIFEKLNVLNKELQGTNMTLVNSKAKIFGFISFLELSQENISVKKFEQFYWLNKCEVTDATCLVIVEHLKIMVSDFNFKFSDLKEINYPSWMTQPLLVDLSDVTMEYQGELSELQNDDSIKALFKIKGTMMWLCEETQAKYPNTSSLARKLLLPFPSSYLVECGFSAVNDLLLKKRNRLDITKRGDLRLKLTKFLPRIKSLCSRHQAQGSH
ncbi:SCAN domain-containing protein 3-like, partial [Homarus americanus]|uniref:SCAN domain-containing protein 3-like n=1 Tax=Homarus americanus TaxID=6706 RepID=UPI001C495FCB